MTNREVAALFVAMVLLAGMVSLTSEMSHTTDARMYAVDTVIHQRHNTRVQQHSTDVPTILMHSATNLRLRTFGFQPYSSEKSVCYSTTA